MSKQIHIHIPTEINSLTNLNRTQKECLSQIDYLNNNPEKGCYATNANLAAYLQKHPRTVQRAIKALQDLGLIVVTLEKHFKRSIKTTFEKIQVVAKQVTETILEGVRHSVVGGATFCRDIYNYKNKYKSFSIGKGGISKTEVSKYQLDGESNIDFDNRCKESEALGVIVKKYYTQNIKSSSKVSKKGLNLSIRDSLIAFKLKSL